MKTLYVFLLLLLCSSSLFAQTQYADYVIDFSTEYNVDSVPPCNTTWAACQIIGAPNFFPNHGDNGAAWAPKTGDNQREFIAVGFNTPVMADTIYVYETFNPNAIDTVYVRNAATQEWLMIWSDSAYDNGALVQLFAIPVPDSVNFPINGVRLAMNSPAVPGWNEIDAISVNDFIPLSTGHLKSSEGVVTLYPNPSGNLFTLDANDAVKSVRITDVLGRVVYELHDVNKKIVTVDAPLASGTYFVEVNGLSFRQTLRLVRA